jgi:putative acetyltransferase
MTLQIRLETPSDREATIEIERIAFGSDDEAAIVQAVRDEEGSFALVAEEDGGLVGHVQFSRAWIGDVGVLALGPIGVLPDRQKRGVGSALIRAGLDRARDVGEVAVVLLGDRSFYPRFGFEPASTFGLRNPFTGVQPDGFVVAEEDFMLAALNERGRRLSGPVRWHPAFGQPS